MNEEIEDLVNVIEKNIIDEKIKLQATNKLDNIKNEYTTYKLRERIILKSLKEENEVLRRVIHDMKMNVEENVDLNKIIVDLNNVINDMKLDIDKLEYRSKELDYILCSRSYKLINNKLINQLKIFFRRS
jgi:Tfp pilus assembly protein PilO